MIITIGSRDAKPSGPVMPRTIEIADHPRAPYSEDLLQLKIFDENDMPLLELTVERTELVRAVRAFEVRWQQSIPR